jgi:hypothetical protein
MRSADLAARIKVICRLTSPRWVAKEKDKRASQHIEAEPDELKKVRHYVRYFVVP